MAKKAILGDDYNPVGSRLQRFKESSALEPAPAAPEPMAEPLLEEEPAPVRAEAPVRDLAPQRAPEPALEQGRGGRPPAPERESAAPPQEWREVPDPGREPVVHTRPPAPAPSMQRLTAQLRCRVTQEELDDWHEFARRVTGKRNNVSALLRGCLVLLENSRGELERRMPEMSQLYRPPKHDHMGTALYEHELAQVFYDAIRAAGKPKDRFLVDQPRR